MSKYQISTSPSHPDFHYQQEENDNGIKNHQSGEAEGQKPMKKLRARSP